MKSHHPPTGIITFKIFTILTTLTIIAFSRAAHYELAQQPRSNGNAGYNLHIAAALGELEKVKMLLDGGTPADAKDGIGEGNALVSAAYQGHVTIGRELVKRGAQVGKKSAFIVALTNKRFDFIKFLAEQCSDVIDDEIMDHAKQELKNLSQAQSLWDTLIAAYDKKCASLMRLF